MKLFWKKYQFDFVHSFFGWWMAVLVLNLLTLVPNITQVELGHFFLSFIFFATPLIVVISLVFLLTSLVFEQDYFRRFPYGGILLLRSLIHFGIFIGIYYLAQRPGSPIQQTENYDN
ncbi:MAG: hypothetical protein AAGI23_12400 [Bacteroidota bacterium]